MKKILTAIIFLIMTTLLTIPVSASDGGGWGVESDKVELKKHITLHMGYKNIDIIVERNGERLSNIDEQGNLTPDYIKASFGNLSYYLKSGLVECGLDYHDDYKIEIHSRADNLLWFEMDFVSEYSEVEERREIKTIPINAGTIITATSDKSKPTVLCVDKDGNGEVDYQVKLNKNETIDKAKAILPDDPEFDKDEAKKFVQTVEVHVQKQNEKEANFFVIYGATLLVIVGVLIGFYIHKKRKKVKV
ncbi:hypothetical protein AGMMS50284_5920 [Clostridia bacterium]|nr:hypothetical protein AGMMS50284_5920 [Clostridia bacterium]